MVMATRSSGSRPQTTMPCPALARWAASMQPTDPAPTTAIRSGSGGPATPLVLVVFPLETRFAAMGAGLVVAAAFELRRLVLLGDPAGGVVVGVDVALAVAETLGSLVVGVAQVDGHLGRRTCPHVLPGPPDGQGRAVRLGGGRQVDHRFGQIELRLGKADVLDGVGGGGGHDEGHRVGYADVLRSEDDEAAGDEAGVLPRFEHAGQPVDAGVRVGAPDRLDEGADDVVV